MRLTARWACELVDLGQNSDISSEWCWEAVEDKRLHLRVQVEGAANRRSSWEKDALGWLGQRGGGRGWKYHLVLHLAMYFSSDFKAALNPLVVRSVLKRGLTACLRSGSLQPRSRAVQQGSGRCSGVRLYLSSQCRNGALATSCQGRTELCLPGSYITFILMVIFLCWRPLKLFPLVLEVIAGFLELCKGKEKRAAWLWVNFSVKH